MRAIDIKKLPNPGIVETLHDRYYIHDLTPEDCVSSHWKDHSAMTKVDIDKAGNITSFEGFGFGDYGRTNIANRFAKYFSNLYYFWGAANKKDIIYLAGKAAPILSKIGSYLSYDSFKQICALSVIRKHLKKNENDAFDILLIGDGYGFLSSLLKDAYPKSRITLIDIGKSLFFQAVNLQRAHPGSKHRLLGGVGNYADDFDFLYAASEDTEKIKNIKYTLAINISSMQEMNYPTIERYFKFMRENCVDNNLFYCCNRVSKQLSGGEVIDFLRYPWADEDRHTIDGICPFYKYYFSARFPFIRTFVGPSMHRLTILKTLGKGR